MKMRLLAIGIFFACTSVATAENCLEVADRPAAASTTEVTAELAPNDEPSPATAPGPVATAPADAQPTTTIDLPKELTDTVLANHLQQLGHPDPRVREVARTALMGLPSADLERLARTLHEHPQPRAVVEALREVVVFLHVRERMQKYAPSRQGFLGMSLVFNPLDQLGQQGSDTDLPAFPGPQISTRVPGFAAERYTRSGDIILAAGPDNMQRPTKTVGELVNVIREMQPGDMVNLTLVRGQRIVTARFPLDSMVITDSGETLDEAGTTAVAEAQQYWDEKFLLRAAPERSKVRRSRLHSERFKRR